MTVIKRGKSYWIDIGHNRTRYRKRSPDNSYKGALAYEALIRQKLAFGKPIEEIKPERLYTFREIAIQWLNTYVKNNNKPSEFEIRQYILNATLIPYFGKKYVNKIRTYDIEQYKSYLLMQRKLSPKSINNYLSILSRCLKSAVEWDIIKDIPKIKLLKVPPQKFDYLTEAETNRLIAHARGIWHDMILFAVRTGLRFGEIIALKWEDIDLKAGILTVNRNIVRGVEGSPKNNRIRTIPLTKSVIRMLEGKTIRSGYVIQDEKANHLKYNPCRKKLHEVCRMAKLRKISWHVLRHTFASQLAAKDISIISIKELLGHSDIKMTMRYSHVNLPILKSAIDSLEPAFQFNGTITAQIENADKLFANISTKNSRGAGN